MNSIDFGGQTTILVQISPNDLHKLVYQAVRMAFGEQTKENGKAIDERLTRKEICKLYKISLPTVHSCMKKGLPFEKIGRKTLFKRSLVDQFFSQKKG